MSGISCNIFLQHHSLQAVYRVLSCLTPRLLIGTGDGCVDSKKGDDDKCPQVRYGFGHRRFLTFVI